MLKREKWRDRVDAVNPLALEFTRQRIRLQDIANPITKRIANKQFIDCELLGPANIVASKNSKLSGIGMVNCDFIVMQPDTPVHNVIVIEDTTIFGGHLLQCTVFVPPVLVKSFAEMGVKFVTLTGAPEIDNPKPPNTEAKKQP
jgi:hypothetical protein